MGERLERILQILITIAVLSLSACSSPQKRGAEVGPRYEDSAYEAIYRRHTQFDKRYDGFYQLYEVYATLISPEIQTTILQKESDVYLWTPEKARMERERVMQESSNSTKMHLVMFTPNTSANDLNRKNSIWHMYLEVDGQRYEGTARKRIGPVEDIRSFIPTHNRFSVAYDVTFNVPTNAVTGKTVYFILTSALGTSRFAYTN
jgi:hypothetical protein